MLMTESRCIQYYYFFGLFENFCNKKSPPPHFSLIEDDRVTEVEHHLKNTVKNFKTIFFWILNIS